MFEHLQDQPADKILALMSAYRADPRNGKIDLGVGVYKNAEGKTPVMRAIKAAERRLFEEQEDRKFLYTGTGQADSEPLPRRWRALVLRRMPWPARSVARSPRPGRHRRGADGWFEVARYGQPRSVDRSGCLPRT